RGQLGNGKRTSQGQPQPVPNLPKAVKIAAGSGFSCSIHDDGTARCWGENDEGEVGDGSTSRSSAPVAIALTGDEQISGGGDHACAIAGGKVWCWGYNEQGQLGDGTGTTRGIPAAVPGIASPTQVAAGDRHTCVLDGSAVKCWGANNSGQLGDNSFQQSSM